MSRKLELEFVKKAFTNRKYTPFLDKYINCHDKIDFICPNGHSGSISYSSFRDGYTCVKCTIRSKTKVYRHKYEFIKNEFEKREYNLISKKYINNYTKMDAICPRGHKIKISYLSLSQGHGCRECGYIDSGLSSRLSYEFVYNEFKKRGCELTTKEYINSSQELEYICPRGHQCKTNYARFYSGHGCFECMCIDYSGEGHYNYNHDLTDKQRKSLPEDRINYEYRKWRRLVLKKDDNICQHCGISKKECKIKHVKFAVHHIFNYLDNEKLRYDVFNGISLCDKCHVLFHSIFGNRNNDVNQIHEFINSQKTIMGMKTNKEKDKRKLKEKKYDLTKFQKELKDNKTMEIN